MSNDPILDEVREAKRKHAERFGFDVRAICADVMASQQIRENEGWVLLSPPPAPHLTPNEALQRTRFARC